MANKTILCVDDSATMRAIVEKTFFAEPFDVVTVPSGEVAVERAKEIKPAIILADAGMVGTTGYDVCRSVRDTGEIAGTPVIVMSGISSPYDEAKAKDAGVTDHVKKPFDTTKLIEKVVELCGAQQDSPADKQAAEPVAAAKPTGSTLHAFPNPTVTTPASPPAPSPVVPKPAAKPAIKATMEFGRPSATPAEPKPAAKPEPAPIELDEPLADEGEIQVGTLAELAQMNEKGEQLEHTPDEDAIDLREPTPTPPSPEPAPAPQVAAAAKAAAQKVAEVEGLTHEQSEAVRKLTADVIEKVVWEVVPDLAEVIIRERIEQLLEE